MNASTLLHELLTLLQAQVEAVVAGDHLAVLTGADRHEQILIALETAELDGPPEELRELHRRIEREKEKLSSLLQAELSRTDILLRAILGGGAPKTGGYPTGKQQIQSPSRMLNTRA